MTQAGTNAGLGDADFGETTVRRSGADLRSAPDLRKDGPAGRASTVTAPPFAAGSAGATGTSGASEWSPATTSRTAATSPSQTSASTMPPTAAPRARAAGGRTARTAGPRRARLQLRHINPWTVLKFSCVLSIALFVVWLLMIGILFGVLEAAGVIDKINEAVTTINGTGSKAPVTAGVVFGGAVLIGAINIVLFIALSTIGSVVYNLCADLVGGIELTLSERET